MIPDRSLLTHPLVACSLTVGLLAPLVAGGSLFSEFLGTGYMAPFLVLLLCGFGLPIPEEITMLGAGFIVHEGSARFLPMVGVCIAGTLLGDSVPYWIGRRFGRRALRQRSVRRAIHPERLRAIEKRFERNGLWAVFVCRFLPGVRLPAWFTAGTLGIPYHRFLLVDAAGAAILVPLVVWLGRVSGERIEVMEQRVEGFTAMLGFAAVALLAVIVIHLVTHHKPRRGLGLGRKRAAGETGRDAGSHSPDDHPASRADD